MNIFTKFHKDWTTIVDFLLIAKFWASSKFACTPSRYIIQIKADIILNSNLTSDYTIFCSIVPITYYQRKKIYLLCVCRQLGKKMYIFSTYYVYLIVPSSPLIDWLHKSFHVVWCIHSNFGFYAPTVEH